MFALYLVSTVSCLMFWHGLTSIPDSEFSKSIAELGYKKWPMLTAAFIPVLNTLIATFLSLHAYAKMVEKARKIK